MRIHRPAAHSPRVNNAFCRTITQPWPVPSVSATTMVDRLHQRYFGEKYVGASSLRQPSAAFVSPIGNRLRERILRGVTDVDETVRTDIGIEVQFLDAPRMNAETCA